MKFFPFDLAGPQFLVFYAIFALGIAVLVRHWHIHRNATLGPVPLRLTDPCRIAMLREGRREAVDVAAMSLIERGLLIVQPDGAVHVADRAAESVDHPIEDAVLRHFATGRGLNEAADAPHVQSATKAMEAELQAQGLLSTGEERFSNMLPALVIPLAVGTLRLILAGETPRNFLLLEMTAFAFLAALIADQRVTALGRRTLEHLEGLLGQGKSRARDLSAPAGGGEVPLLAATFGVGALWADIAGQPEWLRSHLASARETLDFLRARRNQGETSGSGGCGDGGCGGCGGCGG